MVAASWSARSLRDSLPTGVRGSAVAELHGGGQLVPAQLVGQERPQLLNAERLGAVAQLDERLGRLAAIRVGNADRPSIPPRRRARRPRPRSPAGYTLNPPEMIMSFLRSTMIEVARLVHVADVAGQEKAVGERGRGLLRAVPVAGGHVRAADAQLAHLAGGQRRDAGRSGRPRPSRSPAVAGRSGPGRIAISGRMVGAGGRGFGHAPAAADALAGQRLEPLRHLHRQRRAAAARRSAGRIGPAGRGRAAPPWR